MADRPAQGSFLPQESAGLGGPRHVGVNGRVVAAYVSAVRPGREVTLDVDAHLVETTKADAKHCYEGYRAYQPMEVVWAETGLVVADEFRAGNVPASKDIRRMVDTAYTAPRRIEGVPTSSRTGSTAAGPHSTKSVRWQLEVTFQEPRHVGAGGGNPAAVV